MLHLQSTGRLHRRITIRGRNLSLSSIAGTELRASSQQVSRAYVWGVGQPNYKRFFADASETITVRTAPQGVAEVYVLGDMELPAPLDARAVLDRKKRTLLVQARGLPGGLDGCRGAVYYVNLPADPSKGKLSFDARAVSGGVLRVESDKLDRVRGPLDPPSSSPEEASVSCRVVLAGNDDFLLPTRGRSAVFLALAVPDVGLEVSSPALSFESEVTFSRDRQGQSRRKSLLKAAREGRDGYVEREGKIFRRRDVALRIHEIPLEIR